jgi:hypothetical protein
MSTVVVCDSCREPIGSWEDTTTLEVFEPKSYGVMSYETLHYHHTCTPAIDFGHNWHTIRLERRRLTEAPKPAPLPCPVCGVALPMADLETHIATHNTTT